MGLRTGSKSAAEQVVIATDDTRIKGVAEDFGAHVVMTSPDHPSGTDRLAEVADKLALTEDEVVVNVQGDEPLIPPAVIDQVAGNLLANLDCAAATLSHAIHTTSEFKDPSAVKVVSNASEQALYFSRAPIPWPRDLELKDESLPEDFVPQRHIGIYAYRAALLKAFVNWEKAPLEQLESLEQLRILQQGKKIHVQQAIADVPSGIDTNKDLQRVRELLLECKK